ncbi:hypothetical protein EYC84_003635 [Monilinia fructicola]|uniref:Uncharacterized protein n=1 Tax=Monilinia fructicola TaxID=38448 RepID=A0A5M9JZH1_MONFR|nr:hypothetical protein EYC84_003635 [Monilinia fructicola]
MSFLRKEKHRFPRRHLYLVNIVSQKSLGLDQHFLKSQMNATGTSLWVKKPTENGADNALDKAARRPANPESHTDIGTSGTYAKLPIDVKPGGDVSGAGIQFPHGVVKKTWADGFPREDDIKIEEVLQHSTLQHAVLSAFQVEPDWVISKLLRTTKVIWVLQAKTEAEVSTMS